MAIIKLTVELVKLVYKIIECIIRGLLETCIDFMLYCLGVTGAVLFTIFLIRYGVCEGDSCFSSKSLSNLAVVTGFAVGLIAVFTTLKNFLR